MRSLKRATKACLRPLYKGLLKPICRPLLCRLRDFLTAPHLAARQLAPSGDDGLMHQARVAAGGVEHLRADVAALGAAVARLHHQTAELSERWRQSEAAARETDHLVLALLKAADLSAARADAGPRHRDALYVGGDRLLASHPHWPFAYLDGRDAAVTPRALGHAYEDGVRLALERLVRPGATAVEAGARQGYHTLTLAALVAPEGGRVVAFEPDPRARGFLSDSVLCNGLEHTVTACARAAHHENTRLSLRTAPDAEAVRLDDELAGLRLRADFIKLDVGGAEANAIDGAWEHLRDNRDVVLMFKFAPHRLERSGYRGPRELLARLQSIGFKFWSVCEDGALAPMTAEGLLERFAACWGDVVAARTLE